MFNTSKLEAVFLKPDQTGQFIWLNQQLGPILVVEPKFLINKV